MPVRNHRALSLPFLRFAPSFFPGVTGSPRRGVEVSWTVANDIRRIPANGPVVMEEDHETSRFAVTYRHPLSQRDELGVEAVVLSRGGGFLDPIIDGWHKNVLGWSDPVRDSTPFGRSVVKVPGSGTFGSASGLGDTTVSLRRNLNERLSAEVAVKLPTGDASNLLGSGGVDAGISASTWIPLNSRWRVHLQAGLVVQGRATKLDNARGLVDQESVALVYVPNSKDVWSAQWQSEASALNTGIAASDAAHRILTFGYRRRISSDQTIEGYFTEDRDVFRGRFPEGANIGPDFAAGVRWTTKL